MKIVRRSLGLLVLAALALWLWSVLFPGPEKVIRQRLTAVAETASFAPNEGALTVAGNVAKLVGYFSADAEVAFDAPGRGPYVLVGRDEMRQAALAARGALRSLAVEFLDVNVTLAPDKLSATVDLAARGKIPGEPDFYVQEMRFTLKQINGEWLIVRVETVKTLSRGTPRNGLGPAGTT